MFGAVNALFSGFAFAGVIIAIMLQKEELKLQREELTHTREEIKGQKEQLKQQNQTMLKQNFENTFFELLRLQNEITNSIDLKKGTEKITGRDCFKEFFDFYKRIWDKNRPEHKGESEIDRINFTYLYFYSKYQTEIEHYFRSLYNIVKFVDNSSINEKRLYTNLIRAQLSSYELLLLFYNSLSDKGNEKFRPLISKYALLKTVPESLLLNPPDHKKLHDQEAFS